MNALIACQRGVGQAARTLLRPELALVVLMAVVVGMLIVPLPTLLVDLLIALNMGFAIVIFLSSFYVERLLGFSTFPSVLLFTTIMRLALSVSTSRLILVDADAGHIVSAFGQFVVADNLVVGFVVFAIVTVVQFIVITKGAERIGEVVARFSLDGMPGKQMGIDADLRAGSIDTEGAQRRRREVEKESQLYGSYDGAMKFVKGDAIAGIVIVLVNLFGGIAVGMFQHGMGFGQALGVFTLLTIGDGLVAQIPALLICISAGLVVTRISGDGGNLGEGIRSAHHGRLYVGRNLQQRAADIESGRTWIKDASLSPREREVLRLLAMGLNATAIARKLNRSLPTISRQKHSAMRRLAIKSDAELFEYLKAAYG